MADGRIIQKLDEKLMNEGVLDKLYVDDYAKVHSMLNSSMKKTGAVLAEKVFVRGEKKLRTWLLALYKQGASQEKLTSYLRCGLAHLSFDFIESSYKSIDGDDLITRSLLSFKNREFNKSFFRAADISKKIKRKAVKKKKIKAIKKVTPKKKTKKKVVKKIKSKPIKKKIVKKKSVKKVVKNVKKKLSKRIKKKVLKKKKKPAKKKKSFFIKLFR